MLAEHRRYPGAAQITIMMYTLLAWFLLALSGSLIGWFVNRTSRVPVGLAIAVVAPVVVFFLGYNWSARFREFISSVDIRLITLLNIGRILGIVFLIVYAQGNLPGLFAFPAGLGDIFVALVAPLAALFFASTGNFGRWFFIAWNLLGILDLTLAVTLGVVSGLIAAPGSAPILALTTFPLSLIPTFLVPLYFIFHVINLSRVFQAREAGMTTIKSRAA